VIERIGLSAAELQGAVLDAKAGDPASGIIEAASERHSMFIVMCTHTGAAADTIVGRTALAVLRDAPCPVILVRPQRGVAPWMLKQVLLPHDSTPTTSATIGPAADLARKAGAELVVLHVADASGRLPDEHGSLPTSRYADQPQHEWPEWVKEFLDRLSCVCPLHALKVRLTLASGAPSEEVPRAAAGLAADLIVLAWRGEWGDDRAETVKAAIRGATCPVMVLRVRP
jgi:nucleotide-binding universal stress UspA family protein